MGVNPFNTLKTRGVNPFYTPNPFYTLLHAFRRYGFMGLLVASIVAVFGSWLKIEFYKRNILRVL